MIQIINVIYCGHQKSGYHFDEVFSFMSSSFQESESVTICSATDFADNWHDYSYLYNSLTVSEMDRFSYTDVYKKQSLDVHPPLFYFDVHTTSSLFPNVFSKWLGIVPNILYFSITIITLYMLGNRMNFKGWKNGGYLLAIAYGFSAAAISSVVFIRMYAMKIMWTVLACYFQMRIYEESERICWKIAAGLILMLGLFTHYYFIIIQFFISLFCFLYYCFNKKWENAFIYSISMFGGTGSAVILYPAMIKHIFGGYRGTQAFEKLNVSTNNLGKYIDIINKLIFDSFGIILLFLLIIGILIIVKEKSVKDKEKQRNTLLMLGTMVVSICGYISLIAKISPYISERYILCVTPLIITLFVWLLVYVIETLLQNKKIIKLISIIIALVLCMFCYKDGRVRYLYNENKVEFEYTNCDAVIVYEDNLKWKLMSEFLLELQNFSRIYFLPENKLEDLSSLLQDCSEELVIILDSDLNKKIDKQQNVLDDLQEISNVELILPAGNKYHVYNFLKN